MKFLKYAWIAFAAVLVSACLPTTDTSNSSVPQGRDETVGRSMMSNTYIGKGASVLTPHGHRRTTERARRGNRSDRFELRHNDCAIAKKPKPLDCVEDRQRIQREEEPRGVFQRYGSVAWYGRSMFLAPDFPTLASSSVTAVQAKPLGYTPIWDLNLRGPAKVFFWDEKSDCTVGQLSNWRGRWTDIVVFADYSPSPSGPAFQMWVNNRLVCTRTRPPLSTVCPVMEKTCTYGMDCTKRMSVGGLVETVKLPPRQLAGAMLTLNQDLEAIA